MKRIKNLFRSVASYLDAGHINKEGHPSFELSKVDLFLQTLLTNTCGDTFYADREELVEDSLRIHREMLDEDPEFYAKAIVYARTEGCMRLQPVLGVVFLSTLEDKSYFRKVFSKVILTPKDLASFIDLCRSEAVRMGFGRSVKEAVIRHLQKNLTEYHAIKYKTQVRDAVRMSRPSAKRFDALRRDIVEYVMRNEVTPQAPQISAVQRLKSLDPVKDESEIVSLIGKGRLPYESVVGAIRPTRAIWEALLYQMPVFATLRQINTMARHGVFSSEDAMRYVCSKLRNVRESRILPFRLHTALNTLAPEVPDEIREALRIALEESFVNLPEIPGKTCIAPDVSGSMWGDPITIAAIFSAALMKKSDAIVLPVDIQLYKNHCSKLDSVMTNAEKIMKLGGGGTELALPLEYLTSRRIKVDNFICITDSEEWYRSSWSGRGMYPALKAYKRKVNPDVKVFFIRVMPYKDSTIPQHERNLYNIEGWSATVLDFIAAIAAGGSTQKEKIEAISI